MGRKSNAQKALENEPNLEKEIIQSPEPQNSSPVDEIENLLSGYREDMTINPEPEKKKRGRKAKEENTIEETPQISGAVFILLIDLLIPNLICYFHNKYSKKKIKATRLQLTEKQRLDLEPLANEVSKQMMLKANPLTVFIISLLGIYGVNFMMLKNE